MKQRLSRGLFLIAMMAISIGTILGFRYGGLEKAWAAVAFGGGSGSVATATYLKGGAEEWLSEDGVVFYVDIINKGLNFDPNIKKKNQYKRIENFYMSYNRPTSTSSLAIVDPKHDKRIWKKMGINKDNYKKHTLLAVGEAGSTDIKRFGSKTKQWKRIIHPYLITGEATSSENVYYDDLKAKYKAGGIQKLEKEWKNLVLNSSGGVKDAKLKASSKVWAYFTENTSSGKTLSYNLVKRINDYILPSGITERKLNGDLTKIEDSKYVEGYLKYIDYLMTLYTLAKYNNADSASKYKEAINNYIKGYEISKGAKNNTQLAKKNQYKNVGETIATGIEIGGYYWISSDQAFYVCNNIDILEATMGITKKWGLDVYSNDINGGNFYNNDMAKNYVKSYKQKPKIRRAFNSKGKFASQIVNVFYDKKPNKNNGSSSLRDLDNTHLVDILTMGKSHYGNAAVVPFGMPSPSISGVEYKIQATCKWSKWSDTNTFTRTDYFTDINGNNKIDKKKIKGKYETLNAQGWSNSDIFNRLEKPLKNDAYKQKMVVDDMISVTIKGDKRVYDADIRKKTWTKIFNKNKNLDVKLYLDVSSCKTLKNKKVTIYKSNNKKLGTYTPNNGIITIPVKKMAALGLKTKASVQEFIQGKKSIVIKIDVGDNKLDSFSKPKSQNYNILVQMGITPKSGEIKSELYSTSSSTKWKNKSGTLKAKADMVKVNAKCKAILGGDVTEVNVHINHKLKDGTPLRDTITYSTIFMPTDGTSKPFEITKYSSAEDKNFNDVEAKKTVYTGAITCGGSEPGSEPALLQAGEAMHSQILSGKIYKYCGAEIINHTNTSKNIDENSPISVDVTREDKDTGVTINIYYENNINPTQFAILYYLIDENGETIINKNNINSLGVDTSSIDLGSTTSEDGETDVFPDYNNIKLQGSDEYPSYVAVTGKGDTSGLSVWLSRDGLKIVTDLDFTGKTLEGFYNMRQKDGIAYVYNSDIVPLKPVNEDDNTIQYENNEEQKAEYYKTEYWDGSKFVEVVPDTNPSVTLQSCSTDGDKTIIPNNNIFKVYYKVNTLEFKAKYTDKMLLDGRTEINSAKYGTVRLQKLDANDNNNEGEKIEKEYPHVYEYTKPKEEIPLGKTIIIDKENNRITMQDLSGETVELCDESSKTGDTETNDCGLAEGNYKVTYNGIYRLVESQSKHNKILTKVNIYRYGESNPDVIDVASKKKDDPGLVIKDITNVYKVEAEYECRHWLKKLPNITLRIDAKLIGKNGNEIQRETGLSGSQLNTEDIIEEVQKVTDDVKIGPEEIPTSLYYNGFNYERDSQPHNLKADVVGDILYAFIERYPYYYGYIKNSKTAIPILDPYAKGFSKYIGTGLSEESPLTVTDRLNFIKHAVEKNRAKDDTDVTGRIKALIEKSGGSSVSKMTANKLRALSTQRNIRALSVANNNEVEGHVGDPFINKSGLERVPGLDDFRTVGLECQADGDSISNITLVYEMVFAESGNAKVTVRKKFVSDTHGSSIVKSDDDAVEVSNKNYFKAQAVDLDKNTYGLKDTETYKSLINDNESCDYKYVGYKVYKKTITTDLATGKISESELTPVEGVPDIEGNKLNVKVSDKATTTYEYYIDYEYKHSKPASEGNLLVRHWFYDDVANKYYLLNEKSSMNVEYKASVDTEYTIEPLDLSDKTSFGKYFRNNLRLDLDKAYCNKVPYSQVNKVTEKEVEKEDGTTEKKQIYEFKESPDKPVIGNKLDRSFKVQVNVDRTVEDEIVIQDGTVTVVDLCYINTTKPTRCITKFCVDIQDKCYPVDADMIVRSAKDGDEIVSKDKDSAYKSRKYSDNMAKVYWNAVGKQAQEGLVFEFKETDKDTPRDDETINIVREGQPNVVTYHYIAVPPASVKVRFEYLCGCDGGKTVYTCVHDHKVGDTINVVDEIKDALCQEYDSKMKSRVCDKWEDDIQSHDLARITYPNGIVEAGKPATFEVDWDTGLNVITLQYTSEKTPVTTVKAEYHDFQSEPVCYSEVKEGVVLGNADTSNETFEAMAAVPSTETMYFTSGGSEFIMDLYTQYVPDEKAVRKYKSVFQDVDCEFRKGDALKGGSKTYEKQETFVADKDDKKIDGGKQVKAEESHIAKPNNERLTTDENDVKDHEHDTTFKVVYKGEIENDVSAPSDGLQGYKPNEYGKGKCPGIGTYNGDPGHYNIENAKTNWRVDNYNADLQKALDYAKEMEKYSDQETGNVWRYSDSDGKRRVYHVGKAVITVQLEYGDYNADHKQIGTYATGAGEEYSTSNALSSAKLKSNDRDRLGIGWCWWEGKDATSYSDYVEGCVDCNHNGTTKYKSCPTWISLKADEDAKEAAYKAEVAAHAGCPKPTKDSPGCSGGHVTSANNAWQAAKAKREAHERLADTHKCGDFKDHKTPITLPDTKAVLNKAGSNTGVTGKTGLSQIVGPNNGSSVQDKGDVMIVPAGCAEDKIKYTITVTFKDGYTDGKNIDGYEDEGTFVKQMVGEGLPAHALCGPCCEHHLRSVEDTWTQELEYSYERINGVRVWKIEKGKLTGLEEIQFNENDSLMSTIKQGNPNIFYNIADMNNEYYSQSKAQLNSLFENGYIPDSTPLVSTAARAGRIRYTLQSNQLDNVTWNEKDYNNELHRTDFCDGSNGCGTLSAKNPCKVTNNNGHKNKWSTGILYNNSTYTNSEYWYNAGDVVDDKDKPLVVNNNRVDISKDKIKQNGNYNDKIDYFDERSLEFNRFMYRRSLLNTAIVASDTLILQTSTGDQSAMYHVYCQTREADKNYDYWCSDYEEWKPFNGWKWDTGLEWSWDVDRDKNTKRANKQEIKDNNFFDSLDSLYRTERTMTEDNSYAFCNEENPWKVMDTINIGSYNGKAVSDRNNKFSGINTCSINTIFDADGKGGNNTVEDPIIGKIEFINNDDLADVSGTNFSGNSGDSAAPVKMQSRMSRASRLRIWNELDLDPTLINNKYQFEDSVLFYKPILDWTRPTIEDGYDVAYIHESGSTDIVGENGLEFNAPYIDGQLRVNDIVIYDPIAIDAGLIGLGDEDDQRTAESLTNSAKNLSDEIAAEQVCPGVPSLCEFRVLDCKYLKDTDLFRLNFDNVEPVNEDSEDDDENITEVTDSVNNYLLEISGGSTLNSTGNGNELAVTGDGIPIEYSGLSIQYSSDLRLEIGMKLRASRQSSDQVICAMGDLELLIPANKTYPVIRANFKELEDEDGNAIPDVTIEKQFNGDIIGSNNIKVIFDVNNINNCKFYIGDTELSGSTVEKDTEGYYRLGSTLIGETFYIGSGVTTSSTTLYIDDLYITKKAGRLEHTDACYTYNYEHSRAADYSKSPCNSYMTTKFKYSGGVQKFTAPETGDYLLEAYGAQGGGNKIYKSSHGGLGGYSSGVIHLQKGQQIYVYVGGQGIVSKELSIGTQHNGGGYNGGGNGGPNGYGGGGMTHFSTVGTDNITSDIKKEEIIVSTDVTYSGSTAFTDRTGVLAKQFTAQSDGTVKFYSTSHTADPYGHIYVNGTLVVSDDDGGPGSLNFLCTTSVKTGDVIQLYAGAYSGEGSCNWTCEFTGTSTGVCTCSHCANPKCTNYCSGCGVSNNTPCNSTCTIANTQKITEITEIDNVNFNTGACLLVAAGGGGADNAENAAVGSGDDGSGGNGGGTTGDNPSISGNKQSGYAGTQTSGYKQGLGQSATKETDTGGAGGGWYGGKTTNNSAGGAGGGSSYYKKGKVSDFTTVEGMREGDGYAVVTLLTHEHDEDAGCTYEFGKNNKHVHDKNCLNDIYVKACLIRAEDGYKTNLKEMIGNEVYNALNSKGYLDRNEAGYASALEYIKKNVDKIDINSDAFSCNGELNTHVCDSTCRETKTLTCAEPHHNRQHYDTSSVICYSACNKDENHKTVVEEIKAGDGKIQLGAYLNLDREFSIAFFNYGQYYQTRALGIADTQLERGAGFGYNSGDGFDTTKWTREKRVRFNFDVLFYRDTTKDGKDNGEWEQYNAGCWIPLPVTDSRFVQDRHKSQKEFADNAIVNYKFYALLENDEMSMATLEYKTESINNRGSTSGKDKPYEREISRDVGVTSISNIDGVKVDVENIDVQEDDDTEYDLVNNMIYTNKVRNPYYSNNHGVYSISYADIVGRIGNLIISDTDDLRYCNLFKEDTIDDDWLVEGVIHKVLTDVQDSYLSWHRNNGGYAVDVRNEQVDKDKGMYNTWYTQSWTEAKIENSLGGATSVGLPLSGDKNSIEQLKNENLRLGYNVYGEITTMGNYYNTLQMVPYFYALDLNSGEITPVDVYMTENNECKAINLFDAVNDPTWNNYNADGTAAENNIQRYLTDYRMKLNWQLEKARRNYGQAEKWITNQVAETYGEDVDGTEHSETTVGYNRDENGIIKEYTGSTVGEIKTYNDAIVFDETTGESKVGTVTIHTIKDTNGEIETQYQEGEIVYFDYNGERRTCNNPVVVSVNIADDVKTVKQWDTPDNFDQELYTMGTMQLIKLDGNARTFVGSAYTQNLNLGKNTTDNKEFKDYLDTSTNGLKSDGGSTYTNIENEVHDVTRFWKQAQRWHFTMGVPTSTIFAKTEKVGDSYQHSTSKAEIIRKSNEIKQGNYVILMTADIKAGGEIWNLKYDQGKDNGRIEVNGKTYTFTSDDIPTLIAVYSVDSNQEDVDIKSSH